MLLKEIKDETTKFGGFLITYFIAKSNFAKHKKSHGKQYYL